MNMKKLLWFIAGIIGAAVFTLAVGLLSVQISGALSGAVYDLNNTVVGVANPSLPVLQYVAMAALSALLVYSVTLGVPGPARNGWAAGVSLGLLAFIIWALALRSMLMADSGREHGIPSGIDGWILLGGSNSVVHLLLLVSAGALIFSFGRARSASVATEQVEAGVS